MAEAGQANGPTASALCRSIFVLGMHRSGTSALTRALGLCGAALPGRAVEADPATNERGFWEPRDLVDLHDALLAAAGSAWHDVLTLPEGWLGSEAAQHFRAPAAAALQAAYPDTALSVVKDPRLCRLMPFWRPILAELGIEPVIVIAIRNPLEVAASLHKREGFEEGKSLLLWLRHLLAAERDSRGLRRCFVSYDQLLTDWRDTIHRIGQALAIDWPQAPAEVAAQLDAFLSPSLRHHALDPAGVFDRADLPSNIKEAYRWAIQAAAGAEPPPNPLDRIEAEIVQAERIFAPVVIALEATTKRQAETLHHWVGVAEDRYTLIEHYQSELARSNPLGLHDLAFRFRRWRESRR